jgi:hypothetical protein
MQIRFICIRKIPLDAIMNHRAASRAVSQIASPKNCAASCGVFIIPRKRDKPLTGFIGYFGLLIFDHPVDPAYVSNPIYAFRNF